MYAVPDVETAFMLSRNSKIVKKTATIVVKGERIKISWEG